MSEYLLLQYRPIADALLSKYGLRVDDNTRDMLANNIMHDRELSGEDHETVEEELPAPGLASQKNSPIPALRVALTHAKKLLQYADKPPTRPESVPLRSESLAAALRDTPTERDEVPPVNKLVLWELTLAKPSFKPLHLLNQLDAGKPKRAELQRLLATLAAIDPENRRWKIGRPWAPFTRIVRGSCIAWQRAGRRISPKWSTDSEVLSGAFADFVRDLIACCKGTHELMRDIENMRRPKRPQCYPPLPEPKSRGDGLIVSDMAIRDAIRAYQKWCRDHKQKVEPFSLD